MVGIGGPAISDLDVYIFDDEAELFISDADDNPIAVVTFTVEESVLYHSVFPHPVWPLATAKIRPTISPS